MLTGATGPASAVPLLGFENALPPVVEDSTKPRQCTVAYMVEDLSTGDVFLARMLIAAAPDAGPVGGRMPCPASIPPRVGERAMDVCLSRAADRRSCVFADMSRGFDQDPDVRNTAENGSRCPSDRYGHIGVACWKSGAMDVCNVGCGQLPADAMREARDRCETKHQKKCEITGVQPILAP